MSLLGRLHSKFIYDRRMIILAELISSSLPQRVNLLDIGCGDGKIDYLIKCNTPSVNIQGIDILVWNRTYIDVKKFDGIHIPFDNNTFDITLFIDVLHHADDPSIILKEARRVTKQYILVKDHFNEGIFAERTLKLMDYVGNAHNGVRLPYNYLNKREWHAVYKKCGLEVERTIDRLHLFPFPLNLIFDRSLHFFSILKCKKKLD